ncbi:acyl-CoA 6-desaturase [Aplysia californica]|uniref:Acyl-CoA 6-desaturase n=1 Tax=Aplysia californica TaxID=6500 RepID=A0ABM0JMB9_APLCA|nr:acyl-CoA 6-desaturase [Aplysia californica]
MCKTEPQKNKTLPVYSWEEIQRHATKDDRWIVINGYVYDVSTWSKKHPGGEKLLANCAGQDATDAWIAFHNDKRAVSKYLGALRVGLLRPEENKESELIKDFRDLRRTVEDMGLFKASVPFFGFIMIHIFLLEFLGWFTVYQFGTGWLTLFIASLFLVSAQAQAGWAQHDYGHLSVFNNSTVNHWIHIFLLNFFKGVSSSWWNYRHYLHHAKPNRIRKDPDIRLAPLFLLGDKIPVEWGKKKKGGLPYNCQHQYWFLVMPPLLLPLYFNFEVPYFLYSRKLYGEMFWMFAFFVRYVCMFYPFLGVSGALALYVWVRFLESHWFVWTTQMNHIPMDVDYDQDYDWVTAQLKATCNVDQSLFNDWFSGHLNFQIEHHLFPTMPRNNLHRATPLVKSLCQKHELDYQSKTLYRAMADIVGCLKVSGDMWYEAYNM